MDLWVIKVHQYHSKGLSHYDDLPWMVPGYREQWAHWRARRRRENKCFCGFVGPEKFVISDRGEETTTRRRPTFLASFFNCFSAFLAATC